MEFENEVIIMQENVSQMLDTIQQLVQNSKNDSQMQQIQNITNQICNIQDSTDQLINKNQQLEQRVDFLENRHQDFEDALGSLLQVLALKND
ncbi:hypothetical protein SS50377_26815 [Spironucleus salmonicida]|uniref:Uncharacterized protein n=1 Tax=Spironucleus salmonicida TaxID=348837 RepID=V6M780_9EUKA|nr:hypothetical protein SS50377_26815 [Spironucleus salmonicida]|eukprot:EST49284.1 Hypothetical protein SS50377_10507 [Spironucleus salmonicida]